MMDSIYFRQAELLLRVLPLVDREAVFALKGGTAINFFVRDFPRLSVDIDLVYLPIAERKVSLRELSASLVRIAREVETRLPGAKIIPRKLKGADLWSGCSVRRGEATIKIEPNLVMRGSLFPPERRTLPPRPGVPLNSPWNAAPSRSRNSTRESSALPWIASTHGTSSTCCCFSGMRPSTIPCVRPLSFT